jgi:hypothetical protein
MGNISEKKRGRPRKIPDELIPGLGLPELPAAVREMYAFSTRTRRHRANLYYADQAREMVKELSKRVRIPEDPVLAAKLRLGMDWILARQTVLTELGRMLIENPTEGDVQRFGDVVEHVAERHNKLTAKAACAYIRRQRMGETKRKERIAYLHHALNEVINAHHQRFPESTWADVHRAVELTAGQIERKLA